MQRDGLHCIAAVFLAYLEFIRGCRESWGPFYREGFIGFAGQFGDPIAALVHFAVDAEILDLGRRCFFEESSIWRLVAFAAAPSVIQSEVDIWDGIAITFFEQFVDAVEDARRIDPAIPAPSIIGLRSWFGRNAKKPADEQAPETSGTTPSPSGT